MDVLVVTVCPALRLFHFKLCLCAASSWFVCTRGVVQFEGMVLVHQIKGASVDEFTRLATSQLLLVQEGRVWTQLREEMGHVCTK